MSELKRYTARMAKRPKNKASDYYKCSDVDPKLDEITMLKAEITKLKAQDKAQKADIRDWMNEGQQQQKIATEVYAEKANLKALLTETAGVAHHGALLGYTSEAEAIRQVRILTLSHWDKDECTRLQSERRRNE